MDAWIQFVVVAAAVGIFFIFVGLLTRRFARRAKLAVQERLLQEVLEISTEAQKLLAGGQIRSKDAWQYYRNTFASIETRVLTGTLTDNDIEILRSAAQNLKK